MKRIRSPKSVPSTQFGCRDAYICGQGEKRKDIAVEKYVVICFVMSLVFLSKRHNQNFSQCKR